MSRWTVLAATCAIALASGCLGPAAGGGFVPRVGVAGPLYFETEAEPVELTPETYWVVLLRGGERLEPRSGPGDDRVTSCRTPWLYTLDREQKTLRFDASKTEIDAAAVQMVVVADFFGVEFGTTTISRDCQRAYRIDGYVSRADWSDSLSYFGSLDLQVYYQGGLGLQSAHDPVVLPLGTGAGYEYIQIGSTESSSYWVHGNWTVQNLGAWPRAGLTPA